MDKKTTEWLESQLSEAKKRVKAPAAFDKALGIQPGDRFLLPDAPETPLSWVAILANKDDASLWYIVAADQFSLAGSADVIVEDGDDSADLILRSGHGLWAREADLVDTVYAGRISEEFVDHAREKLHLMVVGGLVGTADAELTDDDANYLKWTDEVSQVIARIENRIQSEPVVLKFADAIPNWRDHVNFDFSATHEALAASTDSFGMVAEDSVSPTLVINEVLPGSLVFSQDYDGIVVQYFPAEGEEPEPITSVDGQGIECSWGKPTNGIYLLSPKLPTASSPVKVSFASGKTVSVEL